MLCLMQVLFEGHYVPLIIQHITQSNYCFVQTLLSTALLLKELRNCILRITRVRSLFCSIRVYASLHFLPIYLEN